jgi:hypothetical protein
MWQTINKETEKSSNNNKIELNSGSNGGRNLKVIAELF